MHQRPIPATGKPIQPRSGNRRQHSIAELSEHLDGAFS